MGNVSTGLTCSGAQWMGNVSTGLTCSGAQWTGNVSTGLGSLAVEHSGFSSSATASDLQHRTSEDCVLEPSSIKYLYNE